MSGLVYLVDDDASYRRAVERRLNWAGYEVIAYSSAQQLLDRLTDADAWGCILIDVQMPGLSGLELQNRLIERGLVLPIVFVTGHADAPTVVRAIKAGAEDFLAKPASSEDLIDAIERAMAHGVSARHQEGELGSLRRLVTKLTPRERQVFNLIVRGKINKQVAFELGTTERTVKAHRHQVMEKMHVESFAGLVSIAERLGMLDPSRNSGR